MLSLTIENLSFSVRGRDILKDINVSYMENQMSAILGRNGAGKPPLSNASRECSLMEERSRFETASRSWIELQSPIFPSWRK